MIKRSFFALTPPKLNYDLVEPDPKEPEVIATPSILTLLVNEPLDNTRSPLLKKGDTVQQGQKLCLYENSNEYAISPAAGTISAVDTYINNLGNPATYIAVKTLQGQANDSAPVTYDLTEDIASADAYLRTLPGAPPLKALSGDLKIDTVVITCADADLLSTTSQYMAVKHLAKVKAGAQLIKKLTGAAKLCFTVPENLNIQDGFDSVQVFKTSMTYPASLPAMVLNKHLNIDLPAGSTPEEAGVAFVSAEAAKALAEAYETKSATFEKVLTIIGKQGATYRVKATIGTPLRKIFDPFSIHVNDQDRVIVGGPMQGTATYTIYHPVEPDMDTVIIQDRDEITEIADTACVNCGKCIRVCPVNVPVNLLVRYLAADEYEDAADKCDLESCIECGLCAYVCTARIPIFQYIRLGKNELTKLRTEA